MKEYIIIQLLLSSGFASLLISQQNPGFSAAFEMNTRVLLSSINSSVPIGVQLISVTQTKIPLSAIIRPGETVTFSEFLLGAEINKIRFTQGCNQEVFEIPIQLQTGTHKIIFNNDETVNIPGNASLKATKIYPK